MNIYRPTFDLNLKAGKKGHTNGKAEGRTVAVLVRHVPFALMVNWVFMEREALHPALWRIALLVFVVELGPLSAVLSRL